MNRDEKIRLLLHQFNELEAADQETVTEWVTTAMGVDPPRDIAEWFTDVKMDTRLRLNKAMAEIVRAVRTTGQKGKLALTLSFDSQGDNEIFVTVNWKATVPHRPDVGATFYALDNGTLQREDPRQLNLHIPTATAERRKDPNEPTEH